MASDLSTTPVSGLQVQLCGDAHLSNFGVYGSPERSLVFDLNDFDETLPGPWEWDVKRLTASFAIAARHNGYGSDDELDLPRRAAQAYRTAMHRFADMSYLDVWYAHLDVEEVFRAFADRLTKKERKRGTKFVTKARSKNSLHASRAANTSGPGSPIWPPTSSPPTARGSPRSESSTSITSEQMDPAGRSTLTRRGPPAAERDSLVTQTPRCARPRVVAVGPVSGRSAWPAGGDK